MRKIIPGRVLPLLLCLALLLGAFLGLDIWRLSRLAEERQAALEVLEAEPAISLVSGAADNSAPAQRHLKLNQSGLAIYAGPLDGGGELLRLLELPLSAIPARWLAQLTNGGLEFADEESLLMALDNLDELIEESQF